MNPLAVWLDAQPDGTAAKERLARAAHRRWQTVHLIARGEQSPRFETAKAFESATDGEVSAVELLEWFAAHRGNVATDSSNASPEHAEAAQ